MNKILPQETELILNLANEKMTRTNNFDNYKSLTTQDLDKIVREARIAQLEVARRIFYIIVKLIENTFKAIHKGVRAARTYEELSRLSDRGLANIGLNREKIAKIAYFGSDYMAITADLISYEYGMKAGYSSSDYRAKHTA